jgi:hypothetical protein
MTGAGLRDQIGALFGSAPHTIPAVGPPGTLAVMATPDSEPGFKALLPSDTKWQNRVAARIALRVGTYRPGLAASKLECPVLYCVCETDSLCPLDATLKCASRARRGEVKRYPIGHFDIYLGEWFARAVADQAGFLRRHLLDAG